MAQIEKNYNVREGWATETLDTAKNDYLINFQDGEGHVLFNQLAYSVDGNDLTLSADTPVTYYATVKVNKNFVFDGDIAQHDAEGNPTEYVFANGIMDITDSLTDIKYDLIQGATKKSAITKEQYDALTPEEQAKYAFKEGVLTLTIQTHKGHGNASYNSYRFTTEKLYEMYNNYVNVVNPSRDVHFTFKAVDLTAMTTEEGASFYDATQQQELIDQGQASTINKLWDLHIYEVANGKETEITDKYLADVAAAPNESVYNEGLTDDMTTSSVILKNYGKSGVVKLNEGGLLPVDLMTKEYDVFMPDGKTSYKGSRLNEVIYSDTPDEKFDMGTGGDEIVFSGFFGQDTVTANPDEEITFGFDENVKGSQLSIQGKDVVINKLDTYHATVKVDKDYLFDGDIAEHDAKGREAEFNYERGKKYITDKLTDVLYDLKHLL